MEAACGQQAAVALSRVVRGCLTTTLQRAGIKLYQPHPGSKHDNQDRENRQANAYGQRVNGSPGLTFVLDQKVQAGKEADQDEDQQQYDNKLNE